MNECMRVCSCFGIAVAIACDRSDPPPADAPMPVVEAPAAAPAASPPVPSPAIPPPSPAPADAVEAPTASKVPIAADAPKFAVVGTRLADNSDSELVLLQTGDDQVFAAAGPLVMRLRSDGTIEHDPAWARGIDSRDVFADAVDSGMLWWNAVALGGTWPDSAYFVVARLSGSRGGDAPPETYRRANGIWTRIATRAPRFDWYVREFGPWKDGSVLALKGFDTRYSTEGEGDVDPPPAEVKAFDAAVAREKKLVVLRGRPKAPAFGARDVRAFASLATGHIFAVLDDGTILHHDDATGSERVHTLPVRAGHELADVRVRASAPDRVWAYGGQNTGDAGSGWLARFDGSAWSEVATECENRIESLSIDREGTAYFTCIGAERLYRLRADVIEQIPTAGQPYQVVALAPDDIWITTPPFDGARLLHTGTELTEPFVIPDIEQTALAVLEWAEPQPLHEKCFRVWIPLVAGSDRAAVEAALEGVGKDAFWPEVAEARVQGRVELGVGITGISNGKVKRSVKSVVARLGERAGTPSCNDRPRLEQAE